MQVDGIRQDVIGGIRGLRRPPGGAAGRGQRVHEASLNIQSPSCAKGVT